MESIEGTQRIENGTKEAIVGFGRIIEELLETDRDIFKIMSTARFGGGRG